MKSTKFCIQIALAILITSCAVHKSPEYIQVYKEDGVGLMLPIYIILKPMRKTYNLYDATSYTDISGSIYIKGDTICLTPRCQYIKGKFQPIDSTDISFFTIPLYYIKQKNKLKDITDYKKYPELIPFINEAIFDDFKQKKLIDY